MGIYTRHQKAIAKLRKTLVDDVPLEQLGLSEEHVSTYLVVGGQEYLGGLRYTYYTKGGIKLWIWVEHIGGRKFKLTLQQVDPPLDIYSKEIVFEQVKGQMFAALGTFGRF